MMRRLVFILIIGFGCLAGNSFAQGFVCAVGGGSENYNDWSDAPYSWIVEKSGNGKIIILGVSDASSWIPNYFLSFGASSAYNKKIDSRALADQQSTYDELITANAIFIRGGNQWNYVNYWKGTKTEDAIRYVYQNGGVVAGTSAGAMVIGEIVFTAQSGSIESKSALMGPLGNSVALGDNFLNIIPDVLFDTHFIERGRSGRLMAMLYKYYDNTGRAITGVGIDDKTAICIDNNLIGTVMGSAAVSIFRKDEHTAFTPYTGNQYTIENLLCHQLTDGWKYNFSTNEIEFIPPTAKQVDTSRVWGYPVSDFTLSGNNSISQQLQFSFPDFVNRVNTTNLLIISNYSFAASLSPLTNYLAGQSINHNIIYISTQSLNSIAFGELLSNASCFVFAGDSLPALSLLGDTNFHLGQIFYQKVFNDKTPAFFFGNTGKITGEYYIDNVDTDNLAGYRGKMTNYTGLSLFDDLIFQPLIFEDNSYYENRTSALLWGLMLNRKRIGVYLDGRDLVKVNAAGKTIVGAGLLPLLIIDARAATYVDSSVYRASGSVGPRQIVAMNNLRYSFTRYSDLLYLIEEGKFESLTNLNEPLTLIPRGFTLYQNYPNPFNPSTKIKFELPQNGFVSLKVYDILGREVADVISSELEAGSNVINFNGVDLSSGIYIYMLNYGASTQSKAMLLLK